ncbi:exodeoxyribonuclease III [Prosthecochloris sp. HL-130-GSB]|jgi:exodeoxyribonuclease III|uniref:Exodeoxyribonuclease III n=1 Tax=Prosthecochloris aestuarii TaxID=1102 RepID=A0A831SRR2_PROAE|nr:exodeoxyribonuclease III [Prosthecochloris sp. HL-130-GSB]ARM30115.1 exodeoxyribonuclease III [Prosthecochloris sp. HL-130-GSB]MBO8091695.1 exodeoxyribonuclease III [Prosthecochloris sp.]HED31696.1 exodeoxyribonuclease III [Prosthecochloris aestuarii]
MKIATWNINGIRARKSALQQWITRNTPDILVMQEIKADAGSIPPEILSVQGYTKFWNGSTVRKGYSGTGILVRGDVADQIFEIPDFDTENRTVVVHDKEFTLIGTYVPRGDSAEHYQVKLTYFRQLEAYILSLLEAGREVILTGDMNVAHTDLDVHHSQNKPGSTGLRPEERASVDSLLAQGMHDVMRERHPEAPDMFTWWPYWKGARERNLGWRIDCFYLSGGILSAVQNVEIDREEKSSDHAPVILEI